MEIQLNQSREFKGLLTKALKLQQCLNAYHADGRQRGEAFDKFQRVWGHSMANHFLSKYDDANTLIWALDLKNLNLFIKRF